MCRPKLEGVRFNQISELENRGLIASFLESEVNEAVWECREHKLSNLDWYNFHFIKTFWSLLKNDVMKFIGDFHTNGVFPRERILHLFRSFRKFMTHKDWNNIGLSRWLDACTR